MRIQVAFSMTIESNYYQFFLYAVRGCTRTFDWQHWRKFPGSPNIFCYLPEGFLKSFLVYNDNVQLSFVDFKATITK